MCLIYHVLSASQVKFTINMLKGLFNKNRHLSTPNTEPFERLRLGQSGKDSQDRTTTKELPEKDSQDKTARTEPPGQSRQDRTATKRPSEDRTVGKGQP